MIKHCNQSPRILEFMETIIASIILSLSTNIDNLAVGTAYGIKKLNVGLVGNLIIAFLSGISTFASMSLGDVINHFFAPNLAHKLGSGILILIGLVTIGKIVKQQLNQETLSDDVANKNMTWQEATILGLALTITNLGTGIGAGIAQLNLVLTSCLSFVSSLLMIGGGAFLGKAFATYYSGHRLELISGILLVFLGIYEYLI